MPWTDEMVESLKKMWDEGISTGEIGRRLGVSKNSIVGKVHRLQLTARPSPIKRKDGSTPTKAKSAPKEKKQTTNTSAPKAKQAPAPKTEAKPTPAPKEEVVAKPAPKPTQEKVIPVKPAVKEKEADTYINVTIPVSQAPRKPGDKITVTDLDNHTCRWPIGDPKDENFHFCGANVRIGQTYCEEHAAIAYVKTLKK